jgi:hypothetical protein
LAFKLSKTRPVFLDMAVQGYPGKREGIVGIARIRYAFERRTVALSWPCQVTLYTNLFCLNKNGIAKITENRHTFASDSA